MNSTKQSVSLCSSKSIYCLHGQGQRRIFEPISQQKCSFPVIHHPVRKFCAWTGKNSGNKKKNPVDPKHVPFPFIWHKIGIFQSIPRLQIPALGKVLQGLWNTRNFLSFLFFLKEFLGALERDCKVMVYFWTCARLWNEEYLNDEGSMINRVVLEWLRSSARAELGQCPNRIKHIKNPSSEAWGASKQHFKIFLTK